MAYISFQPKDFFSSKLYTGTGSSNAITGVGFQPDFTWIKNRVAADNHMLFNSPSGVTKYVHSNLNTAETTQTESLKTFDSGGFTVGTYGDVNTNTEDYASWNWKAGTTSGLSGGTITPSAYSINTTSKIGIYKYEGNSTSGATIAHGLGVAPKMLITKKVSATGDWHVAHKDNSAYPWNSYLYLNTTNSTQEENSATWFLNDTAPDATNITLGNGTGINVTSSDYIIYAFAPVKGYSAIGSYIGNVNADGPFVYTGFKPSFVLTKPINYASAWVISDNKRPGYNPAAASDLSLQPNTAGAEITEARMDLLSNGFKINSAAGEVNQAYNYMYIAFAANPIVSSNDVPGTAR